MRNVVVAVLVAVAGWALGPPPAGAETYEVRVKRRGVVEVRKVDAFVEDPDRFVFPAATSLAPRRRDCVSPVPPPARRSDECSHHALAVSDSIRNSSRPQETAYHRELLVRCEARVRYEVDAAQARYSAALKAYEKCTHVDAPGATAAPSVPAPPVPRSAKKRRAREAKDPSLGF